MTAARRLTSLQVAGFVADGALRFDGIVPRALGDAALAELAGGGPPSPFGADPASPAAAWSGRPLAGLFRDWPALAAVLELPAVAAVDREPAGTGPDLRPPLRARDRAAQRMEPALARRRDPRSAARRLRHPALLLLPRHAARDGRHDVSCPAATCGGSTNSRSPATRTSSAQEAMACPAGSLLVCHHGIWHCGQPNRTDRSRTMFKLRLNPRVPQRLVWDTADLRRPAHRQDPQPRSRLVRARGAPGDREPYPPVARADRRRAVRRRLLADADRKRPAGWHTEARLTCNTRRRAARPTTTRPAGRPASRTSSATRGASASATTACARSSRCTWRACCTCTTRCSRAAPAAVRQGALPPVRRGGLRAADDRRGHRRSPAGQVPHHPLAVGRLRVRQPDCSRWARIPTWGVWTGLGLIAIGSGGIKPCVSAHVGDQFGRGNWFRLRTIYQAFYFIINFGSFFAYLLDPAGSGSTRASASPSASPAC